MAADTRVIEGQKNLPEKRWIGRSFGRAACGYDALARLQNSSADELLQALQQHLTPTPRQLLDVGAGTGYPTRRLLEMCPDTRILALDLAPGMLQVARARLGVSDRINLVCADAGQLPLAFASVDLIFSNMALQWCSDLPALFREWRRVLRPGGTLAFSTFGPETLHELKTAWARVDDYSHVMRFASQDDIHQALYTAGWRNMTLETRQKQLAYPDVHALMRELKGLGAHNVTWGRPRHLLGKSALKQMIEAYPKAAEGVGINATFEVMSGFCRVPPYAG